MILILPRREKERIIMESGGSDLVEELLHNSHSCESSHRLNGFQFRYEFQVTLKLDSSSSVRNSKTIGDMRCFCAS